MLNYDLGLDNVMSTDIKRKLRLRSRQNSLIVRNDIFSELHSRWGLDGSIITQMVRRSCITHIIFGVDTYVVTTAGTAALVFDLHTHKFLRFLHSKSTDSVRSVTYFEDSASYVIMYIDAAKDLSVLKLRVFPEALLRSSLTDPSHEVLSKIRVPSPGFVEWDSSYPFALIFSPESPNVSLGSGTKGIYRVFNLSCLSIIRSLPETTSTRECRISRGALIVINHAEVNRASGSRAIPFRIIDLVNNDFDIKINIGISQGLNIQLIDHCSGYLFFKQQSKSLYVFNLTQNTNGKISYKKVSLPPEFDNRSLYFEFCNYRRIFSVSTPTKAMLYSFDCVPLSDIIKVHPLRNSFKTVHFCNEDHCIIYLGDPDPSYAEIGADNAVGIHMRTVYSEVGIEQDRIIGHIDSNAVTIINYNHKKMELYVGDASGVIYVFSTLIKL